MSPDGTFGLSAIPVVLASLVLVAIAVAISLRLRVGVERSIVWAAIRPLRARESRCRFSEESGLAGSSVRPARSRCVA